MADIILAKRGPIQRASQALSAAYNAFFGPGTPLPQQAPAGTDPRALDYGSYVNLSYSPRATEQVSFDQLRSLADAYWLVRIIIETRKDQATKLEWHLGLKPKSGETQQQSNLRTEGDPRVKKLTEFFKRPDGIHNWQTWLRMLIEDLLVTDAVTILPWRTRGGDLYKLVPVDGATIKPVLNPMGIRPEHPEVAYQQVIKGLILAELTSKDLIYVPRNPRTNKIYGYPPVEQFILMINLGIRRALHQLDYYTEGTVPEAVVQIPDGWSSDQIKQFQTWFDSALAGNSAARRRMTFVPSLGGSNAIQWAKDPKLTDEMDELLARAACFAFSIPPTAFVKQNNRATAQQANESATREGLEPLKLWVKDLIDYIIQSPDFFGESKVEFTWDDEPNIDKVKQAQIDDLDIRNGKRSIDELLVRDGYDAIGVGHGIITMSGFVLLEDAIKQSKKIADAPLPTPGAGPNGAEPDNSDEPTPKKKEKTAAKAASILKKKVLTLSTAKLPAAAEKRTKTLTATLTRFLKQQGAKLSVQAAESYGEVVKADEDEINRVLGDLELDWSSLVDSVGDSLSSTAQSSAKDTLVEIGVSDDTVFGLVNDDALAYAKDRAAALVGMKYVDDELVANPDAKWAITETTREELRQIIAKAFDEGASPAEVEAAIRDSTQFSESRAEMISRTEMALAHLNGALEAAKASGVAVGKYSLLSSEHDKDDECDTNAEAGEVALIDLFPSGDLTPPFHPMCTCGMNLVYEGEG